MSVAEDLYLRNAKNPEGFLQDRGEFPKTNEMNVAAVCAGYAFELIFEVLVRAAGGKPDPRHPPRDADNKLQEVGDGRNVLAHGLEERSRDGWRIRPGGTRPDVTVEDFPNYRSRFLAHLRNVRDLRGLLKDNVPN